MPSTPENLLRDLRPDPAEEVFETLAEWPGVRVERITSAGQSTPPGQWLEESAEEWVVVLQGEGRLRFEEEVEDVRMGPGDWVRIAAGRRHRVSATSADPPTVWLAVHVRESDAEPPR